MATISSLRQQCSLTPGTGAQDGPQPPDPQLVLRAGHNLHTCTQPRQGCLGVAAGLSPTLWVLGRGNALPDSLHYPTWAFLMFIRLELEGPLLWVQVLTGSSAEGHTWGEGEGHSTTQQMLRKGPFCTGRWGPRSSVPALEQSLPSAGDAGRDRRQKAGSWHLCLSPCSPTISCACFSPPELAVSHPGLSGSTT